MELISQHAKAIMEGCKERARNAGLRFQDDSLEYIVSNRDMLELAPKNMIPTLYDYWVQDVEVLKESGRYELFPSNPYETVINTRPPISFYNDNNPDWLNVMIFYHVIGHIDFFQNNLFFEHTWDYDFNGKALSDKRLISKLRSEKGRWVDYVIEFAKSVDNLVGFFKVLSGEGSKEGRSRYLRSIIISTSSCSRNLRLRSPSILKRLSGIMNWCRKNRIPSKERPLLPKILNHVTPSLIHSGRDSINAKNRVTISICWNF